MTPFLPGGYRGCPSLWGPRNKDQPLCITSGEGAIDAETVSTHIVWQDETGSGVLIALPTMPRRAIAELTFVFWGDSHLTRSTTETRPPRGAA